MCPEQTGISPEQIAELRENARAFSAAMANLTHIIGPSVSVTEGETSWTRWLLYADPAMTQSTGAITLKLNNSK